MDEVPAPVAQDLNLDVARPLDVLLEVNGGVVESVLGLRARIAVSGLKLLGGAHEAQPLAAPARRSFQHHGVADLASDSPHFRQTLNIPVRAGNGGQPRPDNGLPRRGL